ncbi:MAG TPA: aldehyde dehydrogenase family protein, partial [Solirubrobacteraceae bacterium]
MAGEREGQVREGARHRRGARPGDRGLSDGTLSVLEPATEQVLAEVPRAGAGEADAAVARARGALPTWRAVAPGDRARLL